MSNYWSKNLYRQGLSDASDVGCLLSTTLGAQFPLLRQCPVRNRPASGGLSQQHATDRIHRHPSVQRSGGRLRCVFFSGDRRGAMQKRAVLRPNSTYCRVKSLTNAVLVVAADELFVHGAILLVHVLNFSKACLLTGRREG